MKHLYIALITIFYGQSIMAMAALQAKQKEVSAKTIDKAKQMKKDVAICTICLEDLNAGTVTTTPCKHNFHGQCLQRWVAGTCPICRAVIPREPSGASAAMVPAPVAARPQAPAAARAPRYVQLPADVEPLLFQAVRDGDLETLQDLIAAGASPTTRDAQRKTLLHYAAISGSAAIIEFLVREGASLIAVDAYGNTPLHYAAIYNRQAAGMVYQVGALETLIRLAHERNMRNYVNVEDIGGNTAYDKAVLNQCFEAASILFQDGGHYGAGRNIRVRPTYVEARKEFEERDLAFLFATVRDNGMTPGNIGRILGTLHITLNSRDDVGKAVLHIVAQYRTSTVREVIQLLLEGPARVNDHADINALDKQGKTPLDIAIEFHNAVAEAALREQGALQGLATRPKVQLTGEMRQYMHLHFSGVYHENPLLHVAFDNNIPLLTAFIAAGAYINTRDNLRQTPLHYAASRGNVAAVQLLIDAGADINAISREEKTPLDKAQEWNQAGGNARAQAYNILQGFGAKSGYELIYGNRQR